MTLGSLYLESYISEHFLKEDMISWVIPGGNGGFNLLLFFFLDLFAILYTKNEFLNIIIQQSYTMDKESFFYLTKQLDKIEDILGTKNIRKTEKTIFCRKMDFVMSIFSASCTTKLEIVDKILDNFKPVHIWDVVDKVSTCDCCKRCTKKFGKKKGSCKCACFEIYEIFTIALEKEAYDRLAKIEGRPTCNEILELSRSRKVSKN